MGPKKQGPGKDQHPAESKPSWTPAASDGTSIFPKLSKKKENYVAWHKSANLYLGAKFGRSATFMESGVSWTPEEVKMPTTAEFNALNDLEKAILMEDIKDQKKARARVLQKVKNEDEPQMFALLLGSLDADSYDMVTNHENWPSLVVSKDCAAFLALIETTHYSLAKVSILDQSRAMDNYNQLRQFSNESIAAYKLRFDDAVQRCKALKCAEIAEPLLACQYIKGLDSKRYSAMKVSLENNSRHGIQEYPATLAAAHRTATTWVVSTSDRGKPVVADDRVAFAADKAPVKGRVRRIRRAAKFLKQMAKKSYLGELHSKGNALIVVSMGTASRSARRLRRKKALRRSRRNCISL